MIYILAFTTVLLNEDFCIYLGMGTRTPKILRGSKFLVNTWYLADK